MKNRRRKTKFDTSAVLKWYEEYKHLLHTYLVYLLGTEDTEAILGQSILQSARLAAAKRGEVDPLVLLLAASRHAAKRVRGTAQATQMLIAKLQSRIVPGSESPQDTRRYSGFAGTGQSLKPTEVTQWMLQILRLPKRDREVFVLRQVLALSSIRTSQVVKMPSATVEARLHSALEKLNSDLQTQTSRDALQKLMQDEFAATEPVLNAVLRQNLPFQLREVNNREEWLTRTLSRWQQRRRRKRLVMGTGVPALVLIAAGAAAWFYQPWIYVMGPVQPRVASTAVKSAYTKTLGFVPRIPSAIPAQFTNTYSVWQPDNSGTFSPGSSAPYYYGDILNETSANSQTQTKTTQSQNQNQPQNAPPETIQIIEDKNSANNFNYLSQNGTHLPDVQVNGVDVALSKSQNMLTAEFQVDGVHDIVSARWLPADAGVSQQTLISLIRSMLIHPQQVTATPAYQVTNGQGLAAAKQIVDFTPVLPVHSFPSSLQQTQQTKLQVYSTKLRHHDQTYETLQLNYMPNPATMQSASGTQLTIAEMYGSVTLPQGPKESASLDQMAWNGTKDIAGQQVHFSQQGMGETLFWYDQQDKIGFRVQVHVMVQSNTQTNKLNVKLGPSVMKEIIQTAHQVQQSKTN